MDLGRFVLNYTYDEIVGMDSSEYVSAVKELVNSSKQSMFSIIRSSFEASQNVFTCVKSKYISNSYGNYLGIWKKGTSYVYYKFPFGVYTSDGVNIIRRVSFNFNLTGFTYEGYVPSPGKWESPGSGGFTPPTPTNSKKIEDVPFYQKLLDNGEIGNFDDLSQEEFNYLQDEVQKKEVGLFDTIINKTKDFFMGSSDSNVFRDINISYDENNADIVAYYGDNGLDTSKSYNINMDGIRVGYKDNGTIVPITTGAKIDKSGSYVISKYSKDKFLSDGEIYIGHTEAGSLGGLNSSNVGTNIGTGAIITLLASGAIDNIAENTVDGGAEAIKLLGKGVSYVVSKGQNMYNDWSNSGDRMTDLFNHQVQSESYTKGMNTVTQGEGATVVETTGIVTLDATGVQFPPLTLDSSLSLPALELAPDITFPKLDLVPDLNLPPLILDPNITFPKLQPDPNTSIPVDVSGKSIPIATGGEVSLKVEETTKVKLDTTDATLKMDGFGDLWIAFLTQFVQQLTFKNTLSDNETKDLENKLESHEMEYADDGIRIVEEAAAKWVDKDYKTTVKQGLSDIDGVGRNIQAWQQRHSLQGKRMKMYLSKFLSKNHFS